MLTRLRASLPVLLFVAGCSSAGAGSPVVPGPDAHASDTPEAGSSRQTSDARAPLPEARTPDAGPTLPAGCTEITLMGALASTEMTNPEAYGPQPDLLATPVHDGSSGNPAHADTFTFYLDSADAVGRYPVVPYTNYFYAVANGGGMSTGYAAPDASDAGAGAFSAHFVAVSGTINITSILTPHQTEGTLENVRLSESTRSADGSVTVVSGGTCYWLKSATWNTRRAGGCVPFASNPCAGSEYCMPTNAIGDDGVCVATGSQTLGQPCALTTPGLWDSNCAQGLRCAEFPAIGETAYSCHQVCDVRSSDDICPSMTHCGGDYETCIPVSYLLANPTNGNEIDTVATVGQDCVQNPQALYCGAGGLPGTCWQDTGTSAATCRGWVHAKSECASGDSAGYVAYKAGIDQSTLFCFK